MFNALKKDEYYYLDRSSFACPGTTPMRTSPTRQAKDAHVRLQANCTIRAGKVTRRQRQPNERIDALFSAPDYSNAALSQPIPFLFWLPGKINFIAFDNEVMTGPMSGCLLMTVNWRGDRYAGHLGSKDLPMDTETIQAWNAWQDWSMENIQVKNIRGFYPAKDWHKQAPDPLEGETSFQVYAGYGTNGEFYSVGFYGTIVNERGAFNPSYAGAAAIYRCLGVRKDSDVNEGAMLRREFVRL
jgi:hypothetical protein